MLNYWCRILDVGLLRVVVIVVCTTTVVNYAPMISRVTIQCTLAVFTVFKKKKLCNIHPAAATMTQLREIRGRRVPQRLPTSSIRKISSVRTTMWWK